MVVEALLNHVDDLCVRGDLSALQALEAEQRDGGNCERLDGERRRFRVSQSKGIQGGVILVFNSSDFLTIGTALMERMAKPGGHPMLVKLG